MSYARQSREVLQTRQVKNGQVDQVREHAPYLMSMHDDPNVEYMAREGFAEAMMMNMDGHSVRDCDYPAALPTRIQSRSRKDPYDCRAYDKDYNMRLAA